MRFSIVPVKTMASTRRGLIPVIAARAASHQASTLCRCGPGGVP